ncbi:MAG: hypothetical protein RL357_1327 [Pseudomonadota bacterium]
MISYDVTEWGKSLQQAVREVPQPQGTEVLVRVKYCGVCHSDVHIRDGYYDLGDGKRFNVEDRGVQLPLTMGHEPYGTVMAAGPDAQGVPIGEDRLVYPWIGCGQCAQCDAGQDNYCTKPRFLGVMRPGGYAQSLLVAHPKYLVDVSGIEPSFAPVLACSGLTTYSAINKLMPCHPKDWIVVMGAGGLGLMAVAVLRALGHERIAVCELDESKWEAANAMGAQLVVQPQDSEALATLQGLEGGVYGVLDFVGAAPTAELGIAALRKGGRYVVVGLFGGQISLSLVPMAQRAISIQGSYVGNLAELEAVVALAKSGKLKALPTKTCDLSEVSGVLDQLKAGTVLGRVVADVGALGA